MKIDLTDTTASKINKGLVQARRAIGTPAVGMVLTLVIVTDEENAYDALKAANDASRAHPSRTLVVVKRVSRSPRDRTKSRLDAEVRVGAGSGPGARTLWQTTSGGRLSVTVALFAEYPAAGKRPARPAHLPDTAPYLAAGLTESVSSKTLEVPPAGLP